MVTSSVFIAESGQPGRAGYRHAVTGSAGNFANCARWLRGCSGNRRLKRKGNEMAIERCPLCGAKLRNDPMVDSGVYCPTDQEICAAAGFVRHQNWWSRLAEQVADLEADVRMPDECRYFDDCAGITSVCGRNVKCCPCAAWTKKKGAEG